MTSSDASVSEPAMISFLVPLVVLHFGTTSQASAERSRTRNDLVTGLRTSVQHNIKLISVFFPQMTLTDIPEM